MKKIFKLFVLLLTFSLLLSGCGKSNSIDANDLLTEFEKNEQKLISMDDYYSPKDNRLNEEVISGLLSSVYYDFDNDDEVEYLVARVKDNSLVLTLYELEEDVLKEYDSLILFNEYLSYSDAIDMNCFIKIIDGEPYIFAESVGYSSLVADGISWRFAKVGFNNGKFWKVANDEFNGSYYDEEYLKTKKDFVKNTSLNIDKFAFEENGKTLYEQNKDKALNFFSIKREHVSDFDYSKYYDSKETKVKYGTTTFTTEVNENHDLSSYIK
jgi:hypothetical protein